MKVIAGLGNPGARYRGTRHNIGFDVLAAIVDQARAEGVAIPRAEAKFRSEMIALTWRGEKVLLLSPLTYMNLSGVAVREVVDFYKVVPQDVLVICDDMNLATGRLRAKPGGSAGGQNGLQNIIERLGTNQVPRLRLGIGRPPTTRWDASDWVLGRFTEEEQSLIGPAIRRGVEAAAVWVEKGISDCMNKFNADPQGPDGKATPET